MAMLAAMAMTHGELVDRTPLASAGVTGARLERLRYADGRTVVEKRVDRRDDWLMRATGDDGRIHHLWVQGVFGRLPAVIDAAVEAVEPSADGWIVVMRDVGDSLVPATRLLTRTESRRVLEAATALHRAFAGERVDGLCPTVDRLSFLTPAAVRGVTDHPLRDLVLDGWDRLAALAPADLAAAVLGLLDRPGALAAALSRFPETLLHGDLKVSNIGFRDDVVVLVDWGTLTGMGPPALDLAWYLAVNGAAIDATLDDLVADVRDHLSGEDRDALPLALLGQVALLGWEKALGATSDDPERRSQERAGLDWWLARAAEALDTWSP